MASPPAGGYCFDVSVFHAAATSGSEDGFDVAAFVQRCMAAVPMEELRTDLSRFVTSIKMEVRPDRALCGARSTQRDHNWRACVVCRVWCHLGRQQLVSVINSDYGDFVKLSSTLEGFDSSIHALSAPLSRIQRRAAAAQACVVRRSCTLSLPSARFPHLPARVDVGDATVCGAGQGTRDAVCARRRTGACAPAAQVRQGGRPAAGSPAVAAEVRRRAAGFPCRGRRRRRWRRRGLGRGGRQRGSGCSTVTVTNGRHATCLHPVGEGRRHQPSAAPTAPKWRRACIVSVLEAIVATAAGAREEPPAWSRPSLTIAALPRRRWTSAWSGT